MCRCPKAPKRHTTNPNPNTPLPRKPSHHSPALVTRIEHGWQMLAVDDTTSEEYKAAVLEADVIIAEGHNHVAETRQALETLLDTEVTKNRT